MRLFVALLIGLFTFCSLGCGSSDSYKEREADPNVNDGVLVDDPAMGTGSQETPPAKE